MRTFTRTMLSPSDFPTAPGTTIQFIAGGRTRTATLNSHGYWTPDGGKTSFLAKNLIIIYTITEFTIINQEETHD